jgi:hypothetical protein
MTRALGIVLIGAAMSMTPTAPAGAGSSVTLDGSYSVAVTKPGFTSRCPAGTADECGVFQMAGLGAADYRYVYGATFEPTGTKGCFPVDGSFAITLESDRSTISGPLTGVFCAPGNSSQQRTTPSYGSPQGEQDIIDFSRGTGQFAGLHGAAAFSEWDAGAHAEGTLTGTLNG